MQRVLDRSQQKLLAERCNSLEILGEIHKHRYQLNEPFTSFNQFWVASQEASLIKNFGMSKGLDTPASFDVKPTKTQRQKLVGRLELFLNDGAAEMFRHYSRSLHLTVLLDNKELLEGLLNEGRNLDESCPNSGWTALHLAAQETREGFVDTLLKAETMADAKGKFGYTPLSHASKGEHSEIERLIRERSRAQSNMAYDRAIQINSPFDGELITTNNTTIEYYIFSN